MGGTAKLTDEEIERTLARAEASLGVHGTSRPIYVHVASGKKYAIECVALREEDLVPVVVYRRYGKLSRFVRTVSDFLQRFTPRDE